MKPAGGLTRDERWEARRKAKLGLQPELRSSAAPPPVVPEPQSSQVFESNPAQIQPQLIPQKPTFQSLPDPAQIPQEREYPKPVFYPPPQTLPPDNPVRSSVPAPDSFFTNPISDQDQRRRQLQSDYRQHVQEAIPQGRLQRRMTPPDASSYVPVQREERGSRSQIPMTNLGDPRKAEEVNAKRAYQQELMRQMKDNEEKKKRKTEESRGDRDGEGFFKFGRPGAGAPNRDAYGNIVATRPPKYNENDPRYNNPAKPYEQAMEPRRLPGNPYQPPPGNPYQPPMGNPSGYQLPQPPLANYQDPGPYGPGGYIPDNPPQPYPDQYQPRGRMAENEFQRYGEDRQMQFQGQYPEPQRAAPGYPGDGMDRGRGAGQYPAPYPDVDRMRPQGGYQGMEPQAPVRRFPEDGGRPGPSYGGGYQAPIEPTQQPPLPPDYPPGKQPSPLRAPPNVGGENMLRLEGDYDQVSKQRQRGELARALQEQMEEKKRRQEEEKRQKLLEERLEEAKLEKQRLDLEEEYRREIEKKKKEYQDFQSANQVAVGVAVPKRPKRSRTPLDLPQAEPPRSPPRDPPQTWMPPVVQEVAKRDVPIEAAQEVNSKLENELWRLRNEMANQNNELRESLQLLKANQQRFEAVKELERVREEMRLRGAEEDIRQRELYNAIAKNPVRGDYEPVTRLPAANPLPLVLPRSHPDDPKNSLGLDYADKSLTGESKFLPVVGSPVAMAPSFLRKRDNADVSLASLPEFGPTNVPAAAATLDEGGTGTSSLGIDAINRRNDERLSALERLEAGQGHDEISKLDSLLANYLEAEKRIVKPGSGKGGRQSTLASRGKLVLGNGPLGSINEAEGEASFSLPDDSLKRKEDSVGGWKYSMNAF